LIYNKIVFIKAIQKKIDEDKDKKIYKKTMIKKID